MTLSGFQREEGEPGSTYFLKQSCANKPQGVKEVDNRLYVHKDSFPVSREALYGVEWVGVMVKGVGVSFLQAIGFTLHATTVFLNQ